MIRLRPATRADLQRLLHWDEQPHVQGTGGEDDWNEWDWENQLGRDVPWREFLIAELEGRPIGFVQTIDCREEESHYWGTDCPEHSWAIDIWIGEADCLGKGYGTQMMHLAFARCFAHPLCQHILIDPLADNIAAHRFYQSLGFKLLGPRSFGPDQCLVYQLTRADWRNGAVNA
ncbi:GNAT family N-acetyltransferase [Hyphomonas sp.]|uniref:GNAT family N-acetyltransferase n=1 Tax=Hyphomonas sp. TaxID=87 RepID=UPI001BD198DF|nr:GNAT family N-acetyltransferase [Hyphomonas sp.]